MNKGWNRKIERELGYSYFIVSTCPAEAAIFVLTVAPSRRPEVTYFAGKESKNRNRSVCKNAVT